MQQQQKSSVVHVDPDSTWLKSSLVRVLIGMTATGCIFGTLFYSQVVSMGKEIEADRKAREIDRTTQNRALEKLANSIDKIGIDSIMTRQGQTWIDMQRASNKAKYPDLIWNDLPR